MPAPSVDAQPERRAHLLGGGAHPHGLAVEIEPLAPALVERIVGANRVGMLAAQPGEAEAVTDLLVRRGDEDQVAGGTKALARERAEGDCGGRHLTLHVERTPAPDLAVHELAAERVALPFRRVCDHDVGVREQGERRTACAWNSRDQVRPIGDLRVHLARDAVRLEVCA